MGPESPAFLCGIEITAEAGMKVKNQLQEPTGGKFVSRLICQCVDITHPESPNFCSPGKQIQLTYICSELAFRRHIVAHSNIELFPDLKCSYTVELLQVSFQIITVK